MNDVININGQKFYSSKFVAEELGYARNSLAVYKQRYGIGKALKAIYFNDDDVAFIKNIQGKRGRPAKNAK